jgi:hypothetical protein
MCVEPKEKNPIKMRLLELRLEKNSIPCKCPLKQEIPENVKTMIFNSFTSESRFSKKPSSNQVESIKAFNSWNQ